MRYFIIAGEASGDLHAANLIRALRGHDAAAEVYAYGGEMMEQAGARLLRSYRDIAYMGFLGVALHAGTILRAMAQCKRQILELRPDVVILVDYPGFNLAIAKFVKTNTSIPVYYYISPKVWAWKESRVRLLRAYVDEIFSILPFEEEYFSRRGIRVHYVGNPTVDEVEDFQRVNYADTPALFAARNGLDPGRRIIALLAGSRRQEIRYNLRRMLRAVRPLMGSYSVVVACAPGLDDGYYRRAMPQDMAAEGVRFVAEQTYALLNVAHAALVTSGTATLETALFRVPQVVCYHIPCGRLVALVRRRMLKVRYISLVNLIGAREIVRELVGGEMNVGAVRAELERLLPDGAPARDAMLSGYGDVAERLGGTGAPARAARQMLECLQRHIQQ